MKRYKWTCHILILGGGGAMWLWKYFNELLLILLLNAISAWSHRNLYKCFTTWLIIKNSYDVNCTKTWFVDMVENGSPNPYLNCKWGKTNHTIILMYWILWDCVGYFDGHNIHMTRWLSFKVDKYFYQIFPIRLCSVSSGIICCILSNIIILLRIDMMPH